MAKKKKHTARKAPARKPAPRKAAKKKARRTVLHSSKGKKLYAKRTARGRFDDIQQYSRAHRQDIQRTSKAEKASSKARKARRGSADPRLPQMMLMT